MEESRDAKLARHVDQQGKAREPGGSAAPGTAHVSGGQTVAAGGRSDDAKKRQATSRPAAASSADAPQLDVRMQGTCTGTAGQTGLAPPEQEHA